jgi:hypothetical protein
MSRDGSGNYSPPAGDYPVVAGTVIESVAFNNIISDIANELGNSLATDGQTAMTGTLKLADGSTAAPSLSFNADATTGITRPETNSLGFVAGGAEQARFKSGNFLLGTTTNTGDKLNVVGTSKFTGHMSLSGGITVTSTGITIDSGPFTITNGNIVQTAGNTALAGLLTTLGNVVIGGTTQQNTATGRTALTLQGGAGGSVITLGDTALPARGYLYSDLANSVFSIGSYTSPFYLQTGSTTRIAIHPTTGNVGIGTGNATNASAKLMVSGGAVGTDLTSGLSGFLAGPGDNFSYLGNTLANYGLSWKPLSDEGSGPTALLSGYGGIRFFTLSTERLRIWADGHITDKDGGTLLSTANAPTLGGSLNGLTGLTISSSINTAITKIGNTATGSGGIWGSNTAGNLHIDANTAGSTGRIYLNFYSGKGVNFGNGAGAVVGFVDQGGSIDMNGTIRAQNQLMSVAAGASSASGMVAGDICAVRSGNSTGVIFLGSSGTRYLHYDGGNYVMPNANLYVNGSPVWTQAALTNLNQLTNSPGYAPVSASNTWTGTNFYTSNKGASSTVGANNTYNLEAHSSDGGAAGMSFHRAGAYAVNMGLDPDNVFRIGGWSAGPNLFTLNMAGAGGFAQSLTSPAIHASGGPGSFMVGNHITRFESAQFSVPTGTSTVSTSHGGSRIPDMYSVVLRCVIAEYEYNPGDEVVYKSNIGVGDRDQQIVANASTVRLINVGTTPAVRVASTGAAVTVSTPNWRVVFRCLWL